MHSQGLGKALQLQVYPVVAKGQSVLRCRLTIQQVEGGRDSVHQVVMATGYKIRTTSK